ncbi:MULTISPECIES: helix-turn-helix transcriptional regulator [Streptomyces]|jgi:DNA-binding CsgD family transcriptional regulator|uniref:helix-turn-helix transcriptional regulator n=1 Tax=unclassified Streptomyces TaxID=2593676 RepID=UPI00088C4F4E|nr:MULTISPECIES: LuxR family transcriptional regulator [unclassified Streptomyces]MDX3767917.1 LuxR C-terminal-related transcriptional regulator [Streptomyces sp. AK08-01B]MDX3818144.1 LuxR C-terminal-related transcriptional regulator [Streptomyces sp. AK08-01A]SCZ09067.1 regulatory protein, luxR family [Streptomyces sp. 136MFCol5.1]
MAVLDSAAVSSKPRLVVVDNLYDVPEELTGAVASLAHYEPPKNSRTAPIIRMIGLRTGLRNASMRRLSSEFSGYHRIELGRLSEAASTELAADVMGAAPDPKLAAMISGAGGNPLLIVELVQGLREEGSVEISHERARLLDERIPRRVRDLAQHWLDSLSDKARQLVQVAAAVGGSFMVVEVASMLRETTASMLPALNETIASGLLICPGEQTVFQHELVRRSIADALPAAVRQALRQDVSALRRQHCLQVPMPPEFLVTGGRPHGTPVPGSTDTPAPLPGPAPLPASSTEPGIVHRLLPALLMARSTRTEPLPLGLAEELRASLTAVLQAHYADVEFSGAADARLADRADRITRNTVSLFADDLQRATTRARAMLAAHQGRDDDADAVTATVVLSNLEWAVGNLAEGLRWGQRAVQRLGPATPPMWSPYVRLALATKLSDIGRFEEAEGMICTARTEAAALGHPHTATPSIARAMLLLQSSRLQEAQDSAQTGLEVAAKTGGGWVVPVGQAVLILVALRRGDLASAADYAWRCRAAVGADSTVFPSIHFDWGECLVATAQLGARRTAELLTTTYAHLLTSPQLFVEEAAAAAWFVRLALAADDMPLASAVVTASERLAAANPGRPTLAVAALHARGLLERDSEALRQAAREHVSPCAGALAEEDLGMLLSAQEEKNGALGAAALRSALQRFVQIGSQGDIERIRAFMEEHGTSVTSAPRQGRAATVGWEALTETERSIAHLVSDGLTNRQVARRVSLSPHTVNYHLRAIFRKLGIGSRVEVARHITHSA